MPFSYFHNHSVNGILLLDKAKGLSSNQALQTVKQLFSARKVGHTGSLDPLATGLLPLCFGDATKFSQFLLMADKSYQVSARLGIKTTTGDAEGEIVASRPVLVFDSEKLETVFSSFRGTILQVPPMFSALKYKGKPLYSLARKGMVVERAPRQVTVYTLQLLNRTEDTLNLYIKCSRGTYIRTLIEDIGEALGCGAYVQALRRLGVADYSAEQMLTLEQLHTLTLEQRHLKLLPLDTLLPTWPSISVSHTMLYCLYRGQRLLLPNLPGQGWVRLIHEETKQFIGIGEILEDGHVAPRRLVTLSK